jgi:hypothetical protein
LQTGQDDDHLHPPKLLDHAEAVIEHHRQADDHGGPAGDDRDPYDAAEHDLVEFVRKHSANLSVIDAYCRDGRRFIWNINCGTRAIHYGDYRHLRTRDVIPLDPPGDRSS